MDYDVTVSITDMKLGYDARNIVNQIAEKSKIGDLEALINKAFHYRPVTVSEVEQYLITNKKLIYEKLEINAFDVLDVVTESYYHRWIDKCGNTWEATVHTREDAVAFAHELKNCANCHECFKCTDCCSCSNCASCTNCMYCEACENCSNLEFSQGCTDKHNNSYVKGDSDNKADI